MGEGASAGPVLDSAFLDSEFRLLNSFFRLLNSLRLAPLQPHSIRNPCQCRMSMIQWS
jgi:hypothetical protein